VSYLKFITSFLFSVNLDYGCPVFPVSNFEKHIFSIESVGSNKDKKALRFSTEHNHSTIILSSSSVISGDPAPIKIPLA